LCIKKLNDGNTIYLPPKIKRLVYFVLSGYTIFFYCEETFSPVTVGFVGRFDHFRSALLVFTKTIWVEPIPPTIDWSQIPVGIPLKRPLLRMDWF
jgi:hypothetical protein